MNTSKHVQQLTDVETFVCVSPRLRTSQARRATTKASCSLLCIDMRHWPSYRLLAAMWLWRSWRICLTTLWRCQMPTRRHLKPWQVCVFRIVFRVFVPCFWRNSCWFSSSYSRSCSLMVYRRGLQTMVRGPNAAREAISSGCKDIL